MVVLTVGHSTRPIDEFITLLRAQGVEQIVDVRKIPKSRFNPQFNQEELAASLDSRGIGYTHMPGLGGLRHPKKDSINLGWKNASFRGYADYMQTPEFSQNLEELIQLARKKRTAIMCAEAVPWKCHRSLIADALIARDVQVEHIIDASAPREHIYTPFAKIVGETVTYPGLSGPAGLLGPTA